MLHHDILASFLLVVCAHAQLTRQPPFESQQGATPTTKPRLHDVLGLGANSDRSSPLSDGRHEDSSSLSRTYSGVSPDVQASGSLITDRGNQFSPDGQFSHLALASFISQYSRQHFKGHHAEGGSHQPFQPAEMMSNTVQYEEIGTPKPIMEGATPSPIAMDASRQFHSHAKPTMTQNDRTNPNKLMNGVIQDVILEPNTDVKSSDDVETATMSSLLRETFMGHNPRMLPRHFASEDDNDSQMASFSSPNLNSLPPYGRPEEESAISASKRDSESFAEARGTPDRPGDDSAISVEQRSWRCSIPDVLVGDEELPWTCRQRFAWRHLGEHVYPSRLYEAVCEGRTCWYGHFNCTPITYTLHVLQVCLHGCQDQRVPFPLRSRWQWTDLNVTVGCQCVR